MSYLEYLQQLALNVKMMGYSLHYAFNKKDKSGFHGKTFIVMEGKEPFLVTTDPMRIEEFVFKNKVPTFTERFNATTIKLNSQLSDMKPVLNEEENII